MDERSDTSPGNTVPTKRNPNKPTARHIIIKIAKLKDKERILKAARETQGITCK